MPYGMLGETPEMTKMMDDCVKGVMDKSKKSKGNAIGICKNVMKKKLSKQKANSSLTIIDDAFEVLDKLDAAIKANVPGYPYVVDFFDDFVIVSCGGMSEDSMYKVNWSQTKEGDISVDWQNAVQVDRKVVYEPAVSHKLTNGRRITNGVRTI